MSVAHDAQTRFPATDTTGFDTTTGNRTFTHTPSGTPKGVVVVICATGTAAPVTGVLYGGVAMTLTTSAVDVTEAGVVYIYTLVTGVPAGAQTVTLQGCIAASKFATCSTVTAATAATTVSGSGFQDTTTSASPAIAFTGGIGAMIYGAVHGGAAAPTSYAPGSFFTAQFNADYGALSARTSRSTSPFTTDTVTYNFVFATSDDWCLAAVAIAEAAAVTDHPIDAGPGSYAITGTAATPLATRVLSADPGSYAITGVAATLQKSYPLIADPGSYALSGAQAGAAATRQVNAAPGSYALTGAAAGVLAGRVVLAAPGAYALTGQASTPLATRVVTAAPGTYATTGFASTPLAARTVVAAPGVYALTGAVTDLVYTPIAGAYVLDAQPGSYVLTGVAATLERTAALVQYTLAVDPGLYAIVGFPTVPVVGVAPLRGFHPVGENVIVADGAGQDFALPALTPQAPLPVEADGFHPESGRTVIIDE